MGDYIQSILWGISGAVTMAITLPLLLFVFSKFTPIDEWAEIKKGNMAVGVIMAAVVIGFAVVTGLSIIP